MNVIATAYARLRTALSAEIKDAPRPSPESGFLDYLDIMREKKVANRQLITERLDETPMLASAGYQFSRSSFIRQKEYDEEWARHFRRLAVRQPFPIDRESYFFRPLDLFGICIGARGCDVLEDSDRSWLKEILEAGRSRLQDGTREYYLGSLSAAQLGVAWPIKQPTIEDLSLATLSLLYWISNQDQLAEITGLEISETQLAEAILSRALGAVENHADLADVGLILYATEAVVNRVVQSEVEENWNAPVNVRDAISIVRTICDRFTIVANTLSVRYDKRPSISIDDEYDVQDLFGALLKLHFDDVRPEEWTPSYAGSASRIDFLLKEFDIIVETKMTRKNLDQKEVVKQLAIDILQYQAHPNSKTLICFVYDPTGRCFNPTTLENDLTKQHGPLNVVALVRPHLR
jgi:hypothetical protein